MVEMAAYVNDDTVTYHLTGDTCAAGTRYEMGVATASLCDEFDDIVAVLGVGDTLGKLAIDGGVCGVGYAVQGVGEYFHDKILCMMCSAA